MLTGMTYTILEDDLSGEPTRALIAWHLAQMRANTPEGHVFALDDAGLTAPGVALWTAWRDDRLAGMAALKQLDHESAELKSMRTHPEFLRQGVASALLRYIVAEARRRGLNRLSLETGRGEAFEPALVLYRHWGFTPGAPFGDYVASEFNQFFHLNLGSPETPEPGSEVPMIYRKRLRSGQ